MKPCEHIIGVLNDYEDTRLVTVEGLKDDIKTRERIYKYFYTLSDYADKRKSTNLSRFDYCPLCGSKVDWKAIKKDGAKMTEESK